MNGARMDFYQKYELLDLLKDEGVKVFNAREIATGRRITMFLFVGEQARLHADLLEQLRASQRPGRPDLLEVGDNQGTPYVATEPLGGLADLKRKAAAPQAPPPAPRAGKPPDAFTRVGVWHIPAPAPSGARGATPVTPLPPAATAPPAQPAPGEFTRMFQASAPPQPMGEAAPPAANRRRHLAQPAPGELRGCQAAAPPQPMGEAAPPAPPEQAAPGEFTRMFQAPRAGGPLRRHRPASAAGEFTRFFQSPLSQRRRRPLNRFSRHHRRPPPAPPPASSAPGEFTRIFGRGDMPAAQHPRPNSHLRPRRRPPPDRGSIRGCSRLSRSHATAGAAPAPAPAPAPIAAKKVPWLTLALIVAVVVLLAVVVIMAFALRK